MTDEIIRFFSNNWWAFKLFLLVGCVIFIVFIRRIYDESSNDTKKPDVPLVLSDLKDCGLAVLSMMFASFGKDVSVEQMRTELNIDTTNGMNAKQLCKISKYYGFDMIGYKFSTEDLCWLDLPLILHWNYNNFVVLTDLTETKAFINDPVSGKVEVGVDEFEKSFTGVVLAFDR